MTQAAASRKGVAVFRPLEAGRPEETAGAAFRAKEPEASAREPAPLGPLRRGGEAARRGKALCRDLIVPFLGVRKGSVEGYGVLRAG
jgi:hypothetical protein